MVAQAALATAHTKPHFVLATDISAPPEKVWNALTRSDHVKAYHFAQCTLDGALEVGGRQDLYRPDGSLMLGGRIIAIDPPHRLEMTFEPGWLEAGAGASRCVYEIEATETGSRFTVLHFELPEGQDGVKQGWQTIATRLKSYLETGTAEGVA